MSFSAGALLMAAAQGSPWDDPAPKGRWAGSTAKLASELLPAEMAKDAVSHVVSRGIFEGAPPSSVRFEGRASPTSDGFCSRKAYYVSISYKPETGVGEPQTVVTGSKLRLGDCPKDNEAIFASLNSSPLAGAKMALSWIAWAQRVARNKAPLPFRITCQTETGPDRCADGGREALANLPLEKTYIIEQRRTAQPLRWDLAVTETDPGQLLWDVKFDATPGKSAIDLVWKIPAPF